MRGRWGALIGAVAAVAGPAWAQDLEIRPRFDPGDTAGPPEIEHFYRGSGLMRLCEGNEVERIACQIYIAGVYDGLEAAQATSLRPPRWCMVAGVSASQLRRLVTRHLAQEQVDLDQPAAVLVDRALARAFPCTGPDSEG
jgi:hypothetical protein